MADVKVATKPSTTREHAAAPERAPAQGRPAPSPFAYMRRLAEEMDQLLEGVGLQSGMRLPGLLTRGHEMLRREAGLIPAQWSPNVDVLHRDGQFVVRADLPGLSKDDVKVEVTDELLTIQGERKQEKKEEREGYRYSECTYGSFYRAVPIPEGAETGKATADFRNGVLEVSMPAPRVAASEARRLEVRESK
jgi:HSP20 family protein